MNSSTTKMSRIGIGEVIHRLKSVRLVGHNGYPIYQSAQIDLVENVKPCTLYPCYNAMDERFILDSHAYRDWHLYNYKHKTNIFDLYHLKHGICINHIDHLDHHYSAKYQLLPPIVEDGINTLDGTPVRIICTNASRISAAMREGETVNILHVKGVPREFPFHAYPAKYGWMNMKRNWDMGELDGQEFIDPINPYALRRDYAAVFPGLEVMI